MNQVGVFLITKADYCEAEPLMRHAFVILLSSLGLDHPNSQHVLGNYRKILQDQDLSEEAIQAKITTSLQQG
jgi:hypothetical protein